MICVRNLPKREVFLSKEDIEALEAEKNRLIELEKRAASDHGPLLKNWMFFLDLTYRDIAVLGRVYSFSARRGETTGIYCMSHARAAKQMHLDPSAVRKALTKLTKLGYLAKCDAGGNKPATYRVDVEKCLGTAEGNGWSPEL